MIRRLLPLVILLQCVPVSARTAFNQFEAARSPEIVKQASSLAKWAVECRLNGEQPVKPPMKLDKLFNLRAGVFVTINRNGQPRGCWGTVEPRQPNVAREIIENAIGAATSDTRRKPLAPHELERVTFCVSIVGPLKQVSGVSELAPERYGLLVRSGSQQGILLPGEAKTARWQLAECRRKAGLPPDAGVQMFIFRTVVLEYKGIGGSL